MADDINNAQALQQPEPSPDLKSLGRLISSDWVYPGGGGYRSTMTRIE